MPNMPARSPWEEWTLDSEFFTSLNAWNRRHPNSRLSRILQSFAEKIEVGKPFLEAIPDGPVPIRGLIKALVHLLQLSATLPSKRKSLHEFIEDILAWVEEISQTFQDGVPGQFVERTWKDMATTRDLVNEACHWAAEEMKSSGSIRSRIRLLAIEEKIRDFRTRWETAHIRFSGVSGIRSAQGTDAIIREIRELPIGSNLEQIQSGILSLQRQLADLNLTQGLSLPSTDIPARPVILHGRADIIDAVLDEIIQPARAGDSSKIALMGPGGIGKTTIALEIVNHDEIVEYFCQYRHWIPCDEVPNRSLLLQHIARSLRIPSTSSNDLLKAITTYLRRNSCQRLIVFDNFETLWDKDDTRASSEVVLKQLASFPHISLLLTMRGATKPSGIRWKQTKALPEVIPTLSLESARQVFEDISPYVDDQLDTLLHALDYVPLAVNLVAQVGASSGDNGIYPSELLEEWKTSGTAFLTLHPAIDRNDSLDVSIEFSLKSARISSNPDALRLLSILSLLPGGIRDGNMPSVAPFLQGSRNAEFALRRACLAYHTASRTLQVLSPIRSHVATFHPPNPTDLNKLIQFYYTLAESGKEDPGSKIFNQNVSSISLEESNLRQTLLNILKHPDPPVEAVKAVLCFANYQFWNSPSAEVVEKTVDAVKFHTDDTIRSLLSICLLWQGKLYDRTSKPALALQSLVEAEQASVDQSDHATAGEACYTAGNALRIEVESERSLQMFQRAICHFEAASDMPGIAKCHCSQGLVHFNHHRHDMALESLDRARQIAEKLDNRVILMKCLSTTGHVLRGRNPYEAIRLLTIARDYYLDFGPRYHADICLYHIAIAYSSSRRYKEAYAAYARAYDGFTDGRDTDQIGFCLFHWAETKREEGQLQESAELFRRAEKHWQEMGNFLQQTFCLRGQFRVMVQRGEAPQAKVLGDKALKILEKSGKHQKYLLFARLEIKAGIAQAHFNRIHGQGSRWFTVGTRLIFQSFVGFLFPVFLKAYMMYSCTL